MPRTLSRLAGATVILTRRPEDNAAFAQRLREEGADVVELPCVRTRPLDDTSELTAALEQLGPSDLLVLTSRAGADAVRSARPHEAIACPVAAVGRATAERAASLGMRVLFVARHADARTLGRELPLPRGTIVLARSDLADDELPRILRQRGAAVREVVAYRTVAEAAGDTAAVRRAIERGAATIVFASPGAVDALAKVIEAQVLAGAAFLAIGPRTAEHIRSRLGRAASVAEDTDPSALARAIVPVPREEVLP